VAKNTKDALQRSVNLERSALDVRFSQADAIFGTTTPPAKTASVSSTSKVVRDTFTMPAEDYALLGLLKQRSLSMCMETYKSELVRAGLRLLASLSDDEFRTAVQTVERVKVGRPK
jgi:hypothetical protein